MAKKKQSPSPKTSGYPEEQPRTNNKDKAPDANTPHEPQNMPTQKPKPSS